MQLIHQTNTPSDHHAITTPNVRPRAPVPILDPPTHALRQGAASRRAARPGAAPWLAACPLAGPKEVGVERSSLSEPCCEGVRGGVGRIEDGLGMPGTNKRWSCGRFGSHRPPGIMVISATSSSASTAAICLVSWAPQMAWSSRRFGAQ